MPVEIVDGRALKVVTPDPAQVLATIPKSVALAPDTVLVHWGIEESQVLRNLGIPDVPSPVEKRYSWPGMFKPFAHQKTTTAFLTMYRRAYCFNDPGTGKSASIAWAADYLMSQRLVRRVLIICPLSIMSSTWRSDLFKTVMHRRVDIAHGSREKRVKVIKSDAEFVIINFDGVATVAKEIKAAGFDLVVIDEANAVKSATTNRWEAINSVIGPETWVWMATGTPASQSPVDAYGLAKMMNPSSVPKYFYAFRDMVMYKATQFKWKPKSTAVEIVNRVLQPAIRFTKDECLDLPELLYTTREAPLTPQQEKYYKLLKDQFMMAAGTETVTAANAAANLSKLLQVAGGAVYTDDKNVVVFDISARYKVLLETIEESTHKVLVFVPFRHTIDILHNMLVKDGYATEVVHGGVSANARTEIFNRFQTTPDPRILLIQPAAASHGVTLHAANTVVWWGPASSNEIWHQANARVHRAGQRNPCLVVRLCSCKAEQLRYEDHDRRTDDLEDLLDMYRQVLDA